MNCELFVVSYSHFRMPVFAGGVADFSHFWRFPLFWVTIISHVRDSPHWERTFRTHESIPGHPSEHARLGTFSCFPFLAREGGIHGPSPFHFEYFSVIV